MLNITPATGRLLWILVRQARATRILEVGTSNAYSSKYASIADSGNSRVRRVAPATPGSRDEEGGLEPVERKSDLPDAADAVRWLGPVKVNAVLYMRVSDPAKAINPWAAYAAPMSRNVT